MVRNHIMPVKLMVALTLLLIGRAMTLAFIHRAGGGGVGDPPVAWLMPLLGDAVIGLGGVFMVYLLICRQGLWVWASIVVWNAIAIWDAMSAFVISRTNPWPEFFMLELMGPAMFFAASAMHLVNLYLAFSEPTRATLIGGKNAISRPPGSD